MFEYDNYIDFLHDELVKRTSINRAYSMRAFAKSLGLSSGELSEILRGVRKLSMKSAVKIAKAMNLTSRETKHLFAMVGGDNELLTKMSHTENRLNQKQFDVISEWYHFAILNLAETKDFKWSISWIAERLGIKPFEVKSALDKMTEVGLIKKMTTTKNVVTYKITEDFVMSNDGIPSMAVKKYHRQILEKAIVALETQSLDERDISGIGFAIDKKDMASVKRDISEFQDMMIEKYSKGKKERAYQLEVALFALSKDEE